MNKSMIQKKNLVLKLLVVVTFSILFMFFTKISAVLRGNLPVSTRSDTFPASYQSYINTLKQKYPNATFKAVYTGLDWNTVLTHESYEINKNISTIHSSYGDEWKWKNNGQDNYVDGPYVTASKSAVAYVLDPRNSLTERYVFQFEYLRYNPAISSNAIHSVLKKTPMGEEQYNLYKNAGNWITMDKSYAQIINDVAQEEDVSAMYIASRIKQETGGDVINYGSTNGSVKYDVPLMKNGVVTIPAEDRDYRGYYNFFNIGASPSSTTGAGAIESGLRTARNNNWSTPRLSISGGTKRIKSTYIEYGQYTTYFQKFDVNNPYGNAVSLMAWQYQTHILAPRSESLTSYNAYSTNGLLNLPFMFYVPVYNNMPTEVCPYPTIQGSYYEDDNTRVYLDDPSDTADDIFNIRSSADDSSTTNVIYVLTQKADISQKIKMLRTKKGVDTNWDYVEFMIDGTTIKGYVRNEYVYVYNYTKITEVSLNSTNLEIVKGRTETLSATITPSNAEFKNVIWSSSNNNVATVSQQGVVTAVAEGTTIITVKTEDQNKSATCQVVVKTHSISLDKTIYTLSLGEEITPIIDTVPSGADYTIVIENEGIAKLEDGKVKAVAVGETKIIASLTGTSDKFQANIRVIPEPEYVISNTLLVNNQIITKVTPGTTANEIKGKITITSLTLKLKNSSGAILSDTTKVGTGTKVELVNHQNQIVDLFNIVIYGDVNGDGNISASDYVLIKNHIMDSAKKITGIFINGADPNKDNKISASDYVLIKNYIMIGQSYITQ